MTVMYDVAYRQKMNVVTVSGGTQRHFWHISVSWDVMPCSVLEVF